MTSSGPVSRGKEGEKDREKNRESRRHSKLSHRSIDTAHKKDRTRVSIDGTPSFISNRRSSDMNATSPGMIGTSAGERSIPLRAMKDKGDDDSESSTSSPSISQLSRWNHDLPDP